MFAASLAEQQTKGGGGDTSPTAAKRLDPLNHRLRGPGPAAVGDADRRVLTRAAIFAGPTAELARVIRRCGKDGSCECAEEVPNVVRRRPSSVPLVPSGEDDLTELAPWQERAVQTALNRPGRPSELPVRREMEAQTGCDLSGVRLVEGSAAAAACDAISAEAFTVGRQVVIGSMPGGAQARNQALRHELVHVAQASPFVPRGRLRLGSDAAPAEREARALAKPAYATGPGVVRRQPKKQPPQATGTLLFVTVDPDANTVTFVTTAGSLVYDLMSPTALAMGGYQFGVNVSGNNVTLMPPKELAGAGGGAFQYRIRAGQPNPATLLRGVKTVSVIVGSRSGGGGSGDVSASRAADSKVHVSVRKLTADQFSAMTGMSADALPEGQIVPLDSLVAAGAGPEVPWRSAVGGTGVGMWVSSPTPMSLIPLNSSGILWTDGHLSVWSNVEGSLTISGYRGNLGWYTGPFTERLLTGVPGGWQNDWLFPKLSGPFVNLGRDPQTVIYLPTDKNAASVFADQLNETKFGGDYRYSPPRPPGPGVGQGEAALWEKLYGGKDPVAVRCTNNCVTVPISQVEQAIRSRPQTRVGGQTLDIASGRLEPSGDVNVFEQGRAARMREFMADPQGLAPGASSIRFTPGAVRGVAVVRVGGGIALIYGVYRTTTHLAETYGTPEFKGAVGEEVGGWAGGLLGSALGAAAGAAIACAPLGPVDALCVIAGALGGLLFGAIFGTAGSLAGGAIARDTKAQAIFGAALGFPLTGAMIQTMAAEGARRDYERFMEQNPDADPAMYDRMQQTLDDPNWGLAP